MRDLPKIIEKLTNAKAISVLIIIGIVAFFVYKNFNFITEITFKIDKGIQKQAKHRESPSEMDNAKPSMKPEKKEEPSYSPYIYIRRVSLTPTAFDIPSSLYFEISNTWNKPTKNTIISIDLGRSQIVEIDWRPKSYCSTEGEIKGQSFIRINSSGIPAKESVYVHALISAPHFRKIIINSEDMTYPREFEYENLEKDTTPKEDRFFSSSFMTFLKIILGVAIIVFGIYFTIIFISIVNRRFKIE